MNLARHLPVCLYENGIHLVSVWKCVCVCVRACVRAREREARARQYVRVCGGGDLYECILK